MTTIGFSPPTLDNPVSDAMIRALASVAAARGGHVLVTECGLDVERQAAGLGRLVDAGADALLVYPTGDPQALHPAIDRAVDRGARIFVHDEFGHRAVEVEMVTPVDRMGAAAADLLADALGGTGTVAVVGGVDAPAVTDRVDGFLRRLESAHPGLEVVATVHNLRDNAEGSEAVVAELLRSGPPPAGIFAYNDSSAIGAARAVSAAGARSVVVGSNGDPHGVAAVADGTIAGTVDRHPVEITQRAAELIFDLLERPAKLGAPEKVTVEPTAVTTATISTFVPWNERCPDPPAGSWTVIDA